MCICIILQSIGNKKKNKESWPLYFLHRGLAISISNILIVLSLNLQEKCFLIQELLLQLIQLDLRTLRTQFYSFILKESGGIPLSNLFICC